MGVTISCSMVPRSRSRTMEVAVSMEVSICRIIPISAGTMKYALRRSGVYQSRKSWTTGMRKVMARVRGSRRICWNSLRTRATSRWRTISVRLGSRGLQDPMQEDVHEGLQPLGWLLAGGHPAEEHVRDVVGKEQPDEGPK